MMMVIPAAHNQSGTPSSARIAQIISQLLCREIVTTTSIPKLNRAGSDGGSGVLFLGQDLVVLAGSVEALLSCS